MPEPRSADGHSAVAPRRAALLTLGCARNEVDSEELAGRLHGSGWELVDLEADGDAPDVIVVNTCGFVEIDGTPVEPDVFAAMLRSYDAGVAEFLDLAHVKPNTLGNARMLLRL